MRWQLTLTRQLLLFQLGIVLLVVTAVAAVSLAGSDAAFRRDQGARLRSIAANLAANDTVRKGVADPIWNDSLAAAAEAARSVSGSSFVYQRQFGLDDDVNAYLPFPVRNPLHPRLPVAFRQLLTHTSSIADGPAMERELGDGFRLEEWVRESHPTPFGTVQQFGYQRFTRVR